MLDVITDFWKPVKKNTQQDKLNPEELQIGSSIGFGFVPQALLSGRRLHINGINTYQFGDETLTSFALAQDKEPGVSMIVAESEGEHYLAISRRITISDRMKLFDSRDLENIMDKQDVTRLPCKDSGQEFKGWTVPVYRREIQGLKGRIYKGDYRKQPLPPSGQAQEFEYYLLVSESNEHAIEIEKYSDSRIEVYATIYRRMSDVGEITHPARKDLSPPNVKFASEGAALPKDTTQPVPAFSSGVAPVGAKPAEQPSFGGKADAPAAPKLEGLQVPIVDSAPKLTPASAANPAPAAIAAEPAKADLKETIEKNEPAPSASFTTSSTPATEEKNMPATETTMNGSANDASRSAITQQNDNDKNKAAQLFVQPTATQSYLKQEVKTVSTAPNSFETESIECDLRVANKIIDEAIRNEMRLTDVVRRIIELPVAYPESVQIPMTLTDEDYALLAIRYSIPATDRNAIKRRILEDLNDFSGGKKNAA